MKQLTAGSIILLLTISGFAKSSEKDAGSYIEIKQSLDFSDTGDIRKQINLVLDSLLETKTLESFSVGVIRSGKVYTFHRGKLMNGQVPTDQTLYEIASLTKTFTGTLLAKAILDKKVRLNDNISKFLPESFPNLIYLGHAITYKHLVTHMSGLPRLLPNNPELFINPDYDQLPYKINILEAGLTRSKFWKLLHQVTLDTVPGYKFNYSNAGANLLGLLLERMYGTSYESLLRTHIFKPLKMNGTLVGITKQNANLVAKGKNVKGIEMPLQAAKELNAEGGIISTLDDILKYMQFHLQAENAVIKLSHQELLNGRYKNFENGMFWQILKNGEEPDTIFQNGGAFGTSSWMSLIPDTNKGVVMITNVSGPQVHQQLGAIVDKITGLIR